MSITIIFFVVYSSSQNSDILENSLPENGELLSDLDETSPSPKCVKYDGKRKIQNRRPIVTSSIIRGKQMGSANKRKRHFHHRSFVHLIDDGLDKTNLPSLRKKLDIQQTLERHETYTKYPRGNPGFVYYLKYSLKKDINHNSWRIIQFDFARNNYMMKNNDLNGQTIWVSPKQITAFPDFDNLTPNEKLSMVAECSKIPVVKPNMVSVSSQTEVKIESLQTAWTEIHIIELEEKCYGLQRDIERQKRIIEDLEKKLQIKTKESQMNKDAYKTIRNDHVETHVLVSKDLKHMQAMVETSELRRAECIRMIQTIPAKYLKPYRKSLENMLSSATQACCRVQPKQNENSANIIVYSI